MGSCPDTDILQLPLVIVLSTSGVTKKVGHFGHSCWGPFLESPGNFIGPKLYISKF